MGFVFVGLLIRSGLPGIRTWRDFWLDADLIYFVCTLPTPFLLFRSRRRFHQFTYGVQLAIAGVIALMTLVAVLLMFATIY